MSLPDLTHQMSRTKAAISRTKMTLLSGPGNGVTPRRRRGARAAYPQIRPARLGVRTQLKCYSPGGSPRPAVGSARRTPVGGLTAAQGFAPRRAGSGGASGEAHMLIRVEE